MICKRILHAITCIFVPTDESKQDNAASVPMVLSRTDGDSITKTGKFKHPVMGEQPVQFPYAKLYIYLVVMIRYIDDLTVILICPNII